LPGIDRMLPKDEQVPQRARQASGNEHRGCARNEHGGRIGTSEARLTPARVDRQDLNLVETTNFLALQFIGLIVVIWAVLKLLGTVEDASTTSGACAARAASCAR
jgi:hypothetical protein